MIYNNYSPADVRAEVEAAVAALSGVEFDTIAVRGVSGMMVGVPLSLELGKPLVVVRKPDERAHSSMLANGQNLGSSYIIVDDFKSTGDTMRAVRKGIREWADCRCIPEPECKGEYTYVNRRFTPG